jgi:hypothetical protein
MCFSSGTFFEWEILCLGVAETPNSKKPTTGRLILLTALSLKP